ncbi:HAD family hydrolase [Streptomyces sp. NPDC046759]|uniref:HAD family hydrolase n=1 Tax=Streptomyces sp. NPDC046759 TaxID=3155019 RepID=UPI0033C0595E
MGGPLDESVALRRLIRRARAVLLDFDGPVTDLFGDEPTAPVADEIKDVVRGIWGDLDRDVEECDDSHGILRHLRNMFDRPAATPRDPRALSEAEAIVTRHEYTAVKRAEPAPGAVELVEALAGIGLRLVIVSNNSDGPVREFLENNGLQSRFEAVVGRDPYELRHMKPDPYPVHRALAILDLPAAQTLLIGDQLTDLRAARAAGTAFLGHTPSAEGARQMGNQGAQAVVRTHAPLIAAARSLTATPVN